VTRSARQVCFFAPGACAIIGSFAAQPVAAQPMPQRASYDRYCASCHSGDLGGSQFGPALKGPAFEAHWRDRGAHEFSQYVESRMPPAAPGTLGARAYTEIETFVLDASGVAAAREAVTATPPNEAVQKPEAASRDLKPGERERAPVEGSDRGSGYETAIARQTAALARLTSVTDAMLRDPPDGDWLLWRRTYASHGDSPLAQIDRSNVHNLRVAWSWSLPSSQNETTPLVHDGVMFVQSGATVQALDATNGDLLWQSVRPLPEELHSGRNSRIKSLAIYGDRLFSATADGHVVAFEAKTGRPLWDREVITEAQRAMNGQPEGVALHLHGGPIVAAGKVIVGTSLGVNVRGGCFIVALDAQTGEEAWRFHTIARPGEPGGDSWNGAPLEERFGGGTWSPGSYDPELGLVYFGTGNTYNTATLLEPRTGRKPAPNDGPYTDSTVALEAATGQLKWYFQHVRRDVWDLDWSFEQSLVELQVAGRARKLVVTGGKLSLFDAVDAATGRYAFSADFGLQNLVASIDPKTGAKSINAAVQPEAGKPKLLCPSPTGARNWPATAFDPRTSILYVPLTELCADYTYTPRSAAETAAGGIDNKFATRLRPDSDGNFGRLAALNLATRQIVWAHRQRVPLAGSALSTAGGLVFNGDVDRYFSAYDATTGEVLWRTRLAAPAHSSPVTYTADGRQYVAVVAGAGSFLDASLRALVPEVQAPTGGTAVVVFELPD
jgi:alcohol dehydrogenase (cytochrome c)